MRVSPSNRSNDNQGQEELTVHLLQLKKAALVLRSLDHSLRQRILQTIHQNAGITVTELYIKLHLEQSVASQHLTTLRRAGFVRFERRGRYIHYFVNYERLESLKSSVKDFLA